MFIARKMSNIIYEGYEGHACYDDDDDDDNNKQFNNSQVTVFVFGDHVQH